MTTYALVKDSTIQVLRIGAVPSWQSSPPAGCSCVELTDLTRPDPTTQYDPVDADGKLAIGVRGIVTAESGALRRMTNTEIDTYLLAFIKALRCDQIDARTTELRESGWLYSGNYYSLTADAEAKLNAAFARRADGDFPYPFRMPTVDNASILELVNATAIDTAHKTFFTALNDLIEGGLDLKAQVVAAANTAAVLAINDPR
jgi:hypothetical protein